MIEDKWPSDRSDGCKPGPGLVGEIPVVARSIDATASMAAVTVIGPRPALNQKVARSRATFTALPAAS